jgi:hypothetical protein
MWAKNNKYILPEINLQWLNLAGFWINLETRHLLAVDTWKPLPLAVFYTLLIPNIIKLTFFGKIKKKQKHTDNIADDKLLHKEISIVFKLGDLCMIWPKASSVKPRQKDVRKYKRRKKKRSQ